MVDKEYRIRYLENMLTVTSIMVANGKSDVKLLNSLTKDYYNMLFGTDNKLVGNKSGQSKEDLLDNMEGFRALFREKIAFKPTVGTKIKTDFDTMNLEDIMKSEKK